MSTKLLTENVGTPDRWFRVVLGLVILALAFTGPHSAWGYLGIIPLLTGIVGTCPFYSLFGLSTCPRRMGRI